MLKREVILKTETSLSKQKCK